MHQADFVQDYALTLIEMRLFRAAKSQKVLRASSYGWESYREKFVRGGFFGPLHPEQG